MLGTSAQAAYLEWLGKVGATARDKASLAKVEAVLRDDTRITMLVNNAGVGSVASILQAEVDKMEAMIDLNVTALTRLIYAARPYLWPVAPARSSISPQSSASPSRH